MQIQMSVTDWTDLEQAQRRQRRVRHWRRYQAIRLVAQGQTPQAVAAAVGCRRSSIYTWIAVWKRAGSAELAEPHYGGWQRRVDARGVRQLDSSWRPIPKR
jgi:transposase